MVKIDFEFESEYGIFRDAIVLSDDHNLSDVEIETLKQQRFDNWLNNIQSALSATPQPFEEPRE